MKPFDSVQWSTLYNLLEYLQCVIRYLLLLDPDACTGEFWHVLHRSFCQYLEASPDNVARSLQVTAAGWIA